MNEAANSVLPLTLAQRGLWVGHKIAAADATMNIAEALEIRGELDAPLFMQALHRLVQDMDAARVQITEQAGTPWQSIRDQYHGDLPFLDFSAAEQPLEAARAWMLQRCAEAVDLERDALWSSALFRLGPAHHLWYQQAHHVIYDGFSGGLAARRIAEIYTAMKKGEAPPDSGFGAFGDLVAADRAYRESPRFERDRAFWQQQLADLPEAVSLSQHGRHRSMGGLRRSSGQLSPAQVRQLAELGRAHAASLPQVLISLVAAYYHRVTGADELVIGMPVAARVSQALRTVPGMMANAVALRLRFSPQDSAIDLLQQVSRVVRQALRHQQYRYEDVRRDLGLLGQDRHMAWLGVNIEPFDYQLDFAGAEAVPINLSNGSVEDLTVFFYERGNGRALRFDFDANPALYGVPELERHAARLLRLAELVLADAGRPLAELELLTPQERELMLVQWRGRPRAVTAASLPAQLECRALQQPEAVAVRHRGGQLSYGQLQAQVDMVAALLVADGVMAGDRIAIALPRNPLLLATLLAVMRLGAAYVPLDPDGPAQRTAWVIEDAQPRLLLLDQADEARIPAHGVRRVHLPQAVRDFGTMVLQRHGRQDDQASAETSVYVLYTSGSTGRPKGVEISQSNLLSFLQSMQQELQLDRGSRFLAQTTLSFDIAGLELYLPLLAGASVVLADQSEIRQPRRMAELIAAQAVTHAQATPSLWRMLLSARQLCLDGVHVLVGGEALGRELAAELWRRGRRLSQLYGPTETTIWSTIQHLDSLPQAVPPIGRPLANTLLYVLDPALRPTLLGAVGELHIGGLGVARGYVGRPELNAERFIADPFAADGQRIYRTGDRVRWREDGCLEFVGRTDNQVKIRGHRVEPGEIEHRLESHPTVAMAAVTAWRDERGELALAAYISSREGEVADPGILRRYLAGYLPAHMLPSSLQVLPVLPLTASGKLDRKALPAPERPEGGQYEAPVGPLERQLAELWQDIFGHGPVGRHDNFFELGGDSLTAAQMMTRLSDRFGTELPLGTLFESASVAGLAARLQDGTASQDDPLAPVLCLRRGGQQLPLFCVHPVVGLGWAYAALLRHLDASIPVYALQAHGLRDLSRVPGSLEAMAGSYLAEMRRIQPQGPYRLLGWSLGGMVVQAMAAQLQGLGEKVEFVGLMDAYPFVGPESDEMGDEAQQAVAALQFLGVQPDPAEPAPQTMQAVADVLCQVYGLEQLPVVRSLQRDDPSLLQRVATLTRHHLELARRHQPPSLNGRAVYFQAAPAEGGALSCLLQYRPSAWDPYIQGGLELHAMSCSHQAMLDPPFAAEVGAVLDRLLGPARRPRQVERRQRGDAAYA